MSLRAWGRVEAGPFRFSEHLPGVDVEAMRERFLERLEGMRERMIAGGYKMPETPGEHEAVRLRIEHGLAEFRDPLKAKGVGP